MTNPLQLSILPTRLAVCRLGKSQPIPPWATNGGFFSVTRTDDELSIVCEEAHIPPGVQVERGWRGLKVEGPLDFSLTGILAGLAGTLANAGISLFAISTYDTDYVLVKEPDLEKTIGALSQAGYRCNS